MTFLQYFYPGEMQHYHIFSEQVRGSEWNIFKLKNKILLLQPILSKIIKQIWSKLEMIFSCCHSGGAFVKLIATFFFSTLGLLGYLFFFSIPFRLSCLSDGWLVFESSLFIASGARVDASVGLVCLPVCPSSALLCFINVPVSDATCAQIKPN